ncbi:uncharacterized protein LOC131927550 [Physella acuta]|uniref:uncharacterized protein LOC131927550 n=1 Tax=Physella acuta TaxID=109671 RepID=UPI0027DE6433|nr:uncharacterized protein LOC131927550 [Physella acuta]
MATNGTAASSVSQGTQAGLTINDLIKSGKYKKVIIDSQPHNSGDATTVQKGNVSVVGNSPKECGPGVIRLKIVNTSKEGQKVVGTGSLNLPGNSPKDGQKVVGTGSLNLPGNLSKDGQKVVGTVSLNLPGNSSKNGQKVVGTSSLNLPGNSSKDGQKVVGAGSSNLPGNSSKDCQTDDSSVKFLIESLTKYQSDTYVNLTGSLSKQSEPADSKMNLTGNLSNKRPTAAGKVNTKGNSTKKRQTARQRRIKKRPQKKTVGKKRGPYRTFYRKKFEQDGFHQASLIRQYAASMEKLTVDIESEGDSGRKKAAGKQKRASKCIINPCDVFDEETIRNQKWCFTSLAQAVISVEAAMVWLAQRRLISNTHLCDLCWCPCQLESYPSGMDLKRWCCTKCERRKALRDGSFFRGYHLPLPQIVLLIYLFANNFPTRIICTELGLDHPKTACEWLGSFHKDIERYLAENKTEIGGINTKDEPIIVELDVTTHFKEKYNPDSANKGECVLGGVERISKKSFYVELPDSNEETLANAIFDHVLPGSIVMTRTQKPFGNLTKISTGILQHITEEKMGPGLENEINTRTMHSLWRTVKKRIQRNAYARKTFSYMQYLRLYELQSRYKSKNAFGEFLLVLAELYPAQ